jgi:hypothetical protein
MIGAQDRLREGSEIQVCRIVVPIGYNSCRLDGLLPDHFGDTMGLARGGPVYVQPNILNPSHSTNLVLLLDLPLGPSSHEAIYSRHRHRMYQLVNHDSAKMRTSLRTGW